MREYPETLSTPGWGELTLDPAIALVRLRDPVEAGGVAALLDTLGLGLVAGVVDGRRTDQRPTHLWVTAPAGTLLDEVLAGAGLPVESVAPVYTSDSGVRSRAAVLPDVLLVNDADADVLATATSFGLALDEERGQWLGPCTVFAVPEGTDAWTARAHILDRHPGADVRLSVAAMESPVAGDPGDPLFGTQWNMRQISAPQAWDLAVGDPGVVIAIVEQEGVAPHPDLALVGPPVDPFYKKPSAGSHATRCAGIAAAIAGNSIGVAGVARGCRILSACTEMWSDEGLAAAVRYAVAQGARVVNLSFTWLRDASLLNAAVADAAAAGVFVCGGAGNDNGAFVSYPAGHPAVVAVGGSDKNDHRAVNPQDNEYRGSHYGPELSVVAPSVDSPTTTWRNGQPDYEPFKGTSCATPHVAGVAALLMSAYPWLTAAQVRSIVERTAVKPAGVAFADDPAYPNGTRNAELGYGRVDALRALDFADVMIRDYPDDSGVEPSSPPNGAFWERCDVVVHGGLLSLPLLVFNTDPVAASRLVRGVDNRIVVRVRNVGPATARGVRVEVRVAGYAGTGFVYPGDWTAADTRHLVPALETPAPTTLPRDAEGYAVFLLTAAQVAEIDTWGGQGMHPCVLAVVHADNDYAFASAVTNDDRVVVRRNNVAMRNVTVVNWLGLRGQVLPLLAGSEFGGPDPLRLVIDRSGLPEGTSVLVDLPRDPDAFRVDRVVGGDVSDGDGVHTLAVRDAVASLDLEVDHARLVPLSARLTPPDGAAPSEPAVLRILQQDAQGIVVGGVTVIGVPDAEPAPEPADPSWRQVLDRSVREAAVPQRMVRPPRLDPGER